MYRIISASKDTYITNKIINNSFRATDSNAGQAGTLDLFKLYAESISGSDYSPYESSRLLIKFNLDEVRYMHENNIIDVGDSSFQAKLILHDVYGGQTTPKNFKLIGMPLAISYDEGIGHDIVDFKDVGVANWLTASEGAADFVKWNLPGAKASGSLSDSNIDVIISGTIPGNDLPINFSAEQFFKTGFEDLSLDVTNFVSASVKNLVSNHGFVIGYSGSFETNQKTYFVKRFASRNTVNTSKKPKLSLLYDDSIIDNRNNFVFDSSGSLYLQNFYKGSLANIKNTATNSTISGQNCMILKLETGSFKTQFNVSEAMRGEGRLTGLYSSSFSISQFDQSIITGSESIYDFVLNSGSITFNEIWSSSDESTTYLSSSLTIKRNNRGPVNFKEGRYLVSVLNLKQRYRQNELVRFKVFIENAKRDIVFVKKPLEKHSEIFENMFYRIRDFESGDIIIPFDTTTNSTKLSSDNSAMYFDFYMSSLPRGRSYVFDFMIKENSFESIVDDIASRFSVI